MPCSSLGQILNNCLIILQIQSVQLKENKVFTIIISSDNIAPFVWIEANGISGRFSDNGFLMVTASRTIEFYAWQDISVDDLSQNLAVMSLMDLY